MEGRNPQATSKQPAAGVPDTPGMSSMRQALARSEQITRSVLDSLSAHVAVLAPSGEITMTNAAWERFARENDGAPQCTSVGTDYLAVCREACGKASEGASEVLRGLQSVLGGSAAYFQFEYPCHSPDRQRWFLLQAAEMQGETPGAVVLHIDITERKLMEGRLLEHERLKVLAAGLIDGQEEERHRLARELHDGLNQEVASLSIELGLLAKATEPSIRGEIQALQQRSFALSDHIRRISHELHPPALAHLGLEAALRTLCDEVSRTSGFGVRFKTAGQVPALSPALSLALYRVAQECLRNAAKHSAASSVSVELEDRPDSVRMSIHDDGRGFNTEESAGGLGLESMRERIKLLNGSFELTAAPGAGTRIEVELPVEANGGGR